MLIWCEQPQVPLWQQRAPCGLSIDISLYTLKQEFSTCLPVGRWSICGSPKPLRASFSLLPSAWTVTYCPEVKVSVGRVSDSLTWVQSASRVKWGVLFLLSGNEVQKTPKCFPVLHVLAFHQWWNLWWHFLLSSCSSVEAFQEAAQSLKTLKIIPEDPAMEL